MLQVSIDSNIDEIEKKLSEITDRSRLVMMRAMNRTARNIATTTKRRSGAVWRRTGISR